MINIKIAALRVIFLSELRETIVVGTFEKALSILEALFFQ